jgi:8-oxo-dGTP pyrophosphatase MutT (NUDIX family)
METEKGVIIVVRKKSRGSDRYAVLKRRKNWEGWELPKGHLEGDDYRNTVKIELEEETGLEEDQIKEINDMEEKVSWEYEEGGENFRKEYKAFIVEVSEDAMIDTTANPHDEHEQGFFLAENDVKSLLTYENNTEILEKAVEQIKQQD